jgi:hypothetical protein
MKWPASLILLTAVVVFSGCAHHRASTAGLSAPAAAIVTPAESLAGRVAAYNQAGRFVVLNFPMSPVPPVDQTLFLYRAGLKVATLHVTGPQDEDNTVADIVSGDARVGDEVRDQ